MVNQTSIQSKPWYTPIWVMIGVMILTCIKNLILIKFTVHTTVNDLPGIFLFFLILWPLLLLVEVIIYWVIRKRIKERKWVWAHLLFSLLAFVLLFILRFLIYFFVDAYSPDPGHTIIRYLNNMEFYGFWSSLVIGHVFFIIAIIRSRSGNSAQLPPDDNDLLSEIAS
jgi:glucan phosphoethanolaminetransferase (alkaline phosphatase superfamily)